MDKINQYKDELMAGVVALALGFVVKKGLKKEILPARNARQAIETFVAVSVCSYLGKSLRNEIDGYKQGPSPKPT